MAGVRPAPSAVQNERPERKPPHRADLGFVAPADLVTGDPVKTPTFYVAFFASVFPMSILLTWVYNSTGGSLLMVVLLHATFNLPITLTIDDLGTRATVPVLFYWGLMVVWAIVVVFWAGPEHLSRKRKKQQEEEGPAESGVATPLGAVKPTPA